MKFYPLQLFAVLLLSFAFTACDWLDSSDTTKTSTNANFISLKFSAANTADAAVSKAVFTLAWDAELNDSVIVNLDSLPVNTAIDSVIPTFSFYSSYVAVVYRKDGTGSIVDSVALSGKDTLNFNNVVKIRNTATDQKTIKQYRIKVNVHKVEPNLYQWRKAVSELYTHTGNVQKALMLNNTIYFYNSTGLTTSLYTSTNGSDWSSRILVNDLPDNALLQNMVVFKNQIFLIHNDSLIYSTSNGTNWTKKSFQSSDYWFKNLLYDFSGKLWALVQTKSDSKYHFATSDTGSSWEIQLSTTVNDNFPVGGFAAVSFASRTKQPKVLVAGGYNKNGIMLNNVWSSLDGLYWIDFSKENTTFGYRTGASLIYYEDKLLMFGGVNEAGKMQSLLFMQSVDEGLSWKNIDTTYMPVREAYTFTRNDSTLKAYKKYYRRSNQSVVVDKDKNIILVGGRDSIPQTFTDVWVGRLNKSVFLRK